MSYRPICDLWALARARLKGGRRYLGAYLGGFPERARVLIGCSINDPVLHVCGGMAKYYPYARGFGPNDRTLDIDPATEPDYLQDARDAWPPYFTQTVSIPSLIDHDDIQDGIRLQEIEVDESWAGIIIDPPYSETDADKYNCGSKVYPKPNELIKRAMEVLPVGGKVGLIHYILPACPKNAKFIACVGIICGFNNRIRVFSVFEKLEA